MWIPERATCSTPRILYIHGGSWEYGSPVTDSYAQLASRIANLTGAVVYVPDYPLVPIGQVHTIITAALEALDWLAHFGPMEGIIAPCSLPVPPLFIGGDSSGGGTALSTLLSIMKEPGKAPYGGAVPIAGAFFFSPWTNLMCNTPDYYHHAFAEIDDDVENGTKKISFVGDLMFRGHPINNKDVFTGNALEYVGGNKSLLTDPIASPLYADMEHWHHMPPLYFAVGGSESIEGDSVLFAQKAAHKHVQVQLDVYQGMWHVFPMYSEGCGSGMHLWQGVSALMRTAKFVKSVAYTGKPACSSAPGRYGATPFTVFHYNDPGQDAEWFPGDESCSRLDATDVGDFKMSAQGTDGAAITTSPFPSATVWLLVASNALLAALCVQNARLQRKLRTMEGDVLVDMAYARRTRWSDWVKPLL